MKKLIHLLLLSLVCTLGCAQQKANLDKPAVDKRAELLSIVFRLAGNSEHNPKSFKLYTDRIENYFDKYKDHELIQYTKKMASEHGVGYNAPISLAVHLNNEFDLREDATTNEIDARWKNVDLKKYTSLLKKFAKDTKFDTFFKDNADLYDQTEKRFMPIYENIDLAWYSKFFGEGASDTFYIINAPSNGNKNYGASVLLKNGKKENYSAMGLWTVDAEGMPQFAMDAYFPILIHEFNHAFVNHLTEKHKDILRDSGEKIFATVGEDMSRQAYPLWEIMMNEAFVRAAVVKYMIDHGYEQAAIDKEVNYQMRRKFLWIKALVAQLQNYDKQRNTYPTLDSYMPVLAEAYKEIATKVSEAEEKRPRIVSVSEFENGSTSVDSATKTITINFDRPLKGEGYSVYTGMKGDTAFPKVEKIYYANDNKSVVMEVALEANKEYQFVMKGQAFVSPEGIPINDYEVNFKTR